MVKVPFSNTSRSDSVVVVNVRTSSAMRWSGFGISACSRSR